MDFIRPIGAERDVDPLLRVERARDERERREREREASDGREPPERRPDPARQAQVPASDAEPGGPVEGDDGRLHIDTTA
jgi:hypothetical protein